MIAERVDDWNSTIDGATRCRTFWALDGTDVAQNYICKTDEETIGVTAETAATKLSQLEPPRSMRGIVHDTTALLTKVSAVDVDSACGADTDWSQSISSSECASALSTRNLLYAQLKPQLVAWDPYL